ncbi:flagellar basal body rod protein FlgC [Klenkia terrae]|uniref:flagellar basal body rod protein FlgC n=1 Tax=Klenkia terrae TaxID=1052259 RepID=UPI00361CC085
MSAFDALRIAGSGMTLHRKYLDAVSDNIANINTAAAPDQEAFKERFIVAQAVDYGSGTGGVRVAGAAFGSSEGKLVYSPTTRSPTRAATSGCPTSTSAPR